MYSSTNSSGSYNTAILFSYNAAGQLISKTYQTVSTPKTGTKSTGLLKQTLTYDTNGFLTTESNTNEGPNNGKTVVSSNSKTYIHTDGRLVSDLQRNVSTAGDVTTYSNKYEYDSNGKITKMTFDAQAVSANILTFTNGL
ncbi:hypothetical protein [Spirosoma spitsbergense]|uniref:hypothetical protein n=1 Tax=Spirosoma spitsbergense TaxID=431554 RepID=UPI000381567D|nr:hypothetical protein [Spirosoma spitsbergense]